MVFVSSFPLGRCVDKVVDSWKNYQRYKYVFSFIKTRLESSISWMMKESFRLSEELFLMYRFVWTTLDDVNKTKVKSHDKKTKTSKQFWHLEPYFMDRWGYFMGCLMGVW